jgi:hypothetical protein
MANCDARPQQVEVGLAVAAGAALPTVRAPLILFVFSDAGCS